MSAELLNVFYFSLAIAKVLVGTGVGFGLAIVVLAECCGFRVVAFGFEQVRAEQLATTENRCQAREHWATSSARKLGECA